MKNDAFSKALTNIMFQPHPTQPPKEEKLEHKVIFLDSDATPEEVEEYIDKANDL